MTIEFLDEEVSEPTATTQPSTRRIVFAGEEDVIEQPQRPVGTSFSQEVSQLGPAFIESLGRPLENMGEGFEVVGFQGVANALKGAITEPENYVSAAERFMEPQPGESQFLGFAWQYAPRAAVEQTGQALAAIGGRIAGAVAGGLVAGPPGAIAGGFLGPAIIGAAQVIGPVAKERARNNGREVPTNQDLAAATLTAIGSGALDAIGARYLPGGDKATGKFFKRVASSFVGEGLLTEAPQSIVEQVGSTAGTEAGLNINAKQALGEGIIGGTTAFGLQAITYPLTKEPKNQVIRTPEQAEEIDIQAKSNEEAVSLMGQPADQDKNELISRVNEIEKVVANNETLINALEPNDETRTQLELENKIAKQEAGRLRGELEKSVGLAPIPTAEQQQVELAKQIAAPVEPAPTEAPAVTPVPVAETPAVAPAPEVAPAPTEYKGKVKREYESGLKAGETAMVKPTGVSEEAVSAMELDDMRKDVRAAKDKSAGNAMVRAYRHGKTQGRVNRNAPVFAEAAESYNITLPEGYTKQGDMYVYQPAAATPVTTPPVTEAVTPTPAAPTPAAPKVAPDWEKMSVFDKAGAINLNERVINHPLFNKLKKSIDATWAKTQGKGEVYQQDNDLQYSYLDATILDKNPDAKKTAEKIASDLGVKIVKAPATSLFGGFRLEIPKPATATTPTIPTPTAPAEAAPAGIAVGNRIKLGKSPQTYTVEEVIPQSETERGLGEQFYSVKNERTGEVQVVESADLKPIAQKVIKEPTTPQQQTEQQVELSQEQTTLVDEAVKEAGGVVFDVYNKLVNESKTDEQVAQELGISKFDVRKFKLRADTAIARKLKENGIQPLGFVPKNPVAEFAEKGARRYLTKEGWLPKIVFQSWVKRNAALSREQKEAEYAIKDLYDGIRKVFGISKMEMIAKGLVSVPKEFVQQLNDALTRKIDINTMPEPVREPLTRMRQHVDTMSRQLVELNVLPDDLTAKISKNLGVYLTRSYKIFTDKDWINKIPSDKLNAARNFLYEQQLKSDPTATLETADRELRNMLNDWASEAEGLRKRGGKLGAKDLSVMMQRAEVPKVLREVMGENMNVVFNYANTIGKISRFLADQRFLNEVKTKGTGQFLFTAENAPKGFNTQIAAEESRTMSPLNGLRTTPEIAKAFEEFGKGYDARENPGLFVLGWLNAVGKLNLTVGSVLTQMRNLLGQPAFFIFNGHYNWRVIREELDAIAKEKGISREDAKRELIKQAAGQGLVNENAYAGELRTAFQEVGLETFDDAGPDEFVKEFVLTRMFKQGVRSAQDLYQKTDEFGKLVGWLNETKRIQNMNEGMDKATAQSIAAERTRNTYPTYSQASEALRLFRRQPFIGPFATFFYETFRTAYHNLRYAFEDINGPTEKHKAEGIKRLAGAMAQISAGAFAVNLLSQLASGIGDDEEEDVRRMLPPWAKDASLAWLPKSKDGTYNFINLSYINPYNALTDPFIAMMSGFARGDKPEEILAQAFGSFLSPFSSEQPVSATIADAMRNRTQTGKQIYNPQDDITTKTSKIMLHIFGKTFTPGTVTRLRERIIPAIQGETVGVRAPAPVREIAAELTGVRFETLDMKAAFSNKAWEFSKAANEAERIFRDVATRRRKVNEQEQIDAYRRSEQTRYEIWNEMYRDYMAVRRAGASQSEAVRLMTDIGISKKEAQAIARGRYTPYEISDEVKRRSKLNGNTVPLTQIKAIGREMPKVLTDIAAE